MRDLLDRIDQLAEARGLSARQPGETFVQTGTKGGAEHTITFQGLDFYPKVGSFRSADEMLKAYQDLARKLGQVPEPVNKPSGGTLAFGVAQFDTPAGPRYLVKFAKEIKPVRTQNTFFQTDDIPGAFQQTSSRGSKEKVGYKPSDVLTDLRSQTPQNIVAQIGARFGKDSAEYQAAVIFLQSTTFPVEVPAGNMDFAAFRDYFCEMLQPIALINNMPVTGNAQEAARVFLKGGYEDCVVSFNQSVSGAFYDSLLVNPKGRQIKLSSKGAKGAMASVINLLKSAQELKQAGIADLVSEYQEVIDILETINQGDHNSGPLELAVKFGIIKANEVDKVMDLAQYSGARKFDIEKVPGITRNLVKIYRDRTAEDPSKVIPINHMVASIAYKVCDYVNLNTDFSEAAADILNNSAFVQMYTEAAKKGDTFVIKGFRTVWPSKLFTEVTLEAQKSYSSTSSSGGRLVFNINKEPKAVPNRETMLGGATVAASRAKTTAQDLDAVGQKRLTGPGARAARSSAEPKITPDVVGREKRARGR
jgi:hypothetical protein